MLRFKDYGLLLTAIIGLGLAAPQNVATEYARIDGGYDDYTRKPSRQFSLVGRWSGRNYLELRDNRSLASVFDRDGSPLDQRLMLLHQIEGPRGDVQTDLSRIPAKYQDGLGGNTDNQYSETTPITFTSYFPMVLADKEEGAALSVQQSVTNANGLLQRSPAGVWSAMSTGVSGGAGDKVMAIVRANDGTVYVGGDFTDAGGSGADYIASWNGSAFAVVGSATALNAEVVALAIGPDGTTLYAGGLFGNAGGDANADFIAKWNGAAWSALGTGTNGAVLCVAVAPNGDVYIGGTFLLAGGVANTVRIAKWNGAVWAPLSTGANGSVTNLAFAADGTLYAVGDFTTIGGVTVNGTAKWNGTAWSALSTGAGTVNMDGLAIAKNGLVYAGGSTTTIGGITVNNIASWNGVGWSALGTGVNGQAYRIVVAPDGTIYVGGPISTAGGITVPDGLVRWNGAAWIYTDVDLPGVPTVQAITFAPDGTLYVGFNTAGTATTAANTTITNTGSARTYPTFVIKGPSSGTSRIYQITNYTTGRSIYLNLTLNAGETAILRFAPDNLSFVSDFQGSIASKILPGSNEADFFLSPGANVISFFAADSTVTGVLYWRPSYLSLDDVP